MNPGASSLHQTTVSQAASISVVARTTPIHAAVLAVTGGRQPGLATLRVRPAELRAEIPVVKPG